MEYGFIKVYRQLLDWEWYDDNNVKILFLHLLLKANYKEKKWRGTIIKEGELITSIQTLATETHLTVKQIRTCINKLKRTNEITIQTTNSFTLISLQNYNKYNDQKTSEQTNGGQTEDKQRATTKERKEYKEINNNLSNDKLENGKFSSYEKKSEKDFEEKEKTKLKEKVCNENESVKSSAENLEVAEVEKVEYGNKEINQMLIYLQKIIGISDFKETKNWERRYAKHILNLGKKIGKDKFDFRLKSILEDEFKSKNCNSIKFLYGELKSFIHSSIVEIKPKDKREITFG